MKLRLRLRQEIGKRDILTLLFKRLIKNLNLSDFSYIKQVDGQIRLRETKISLYGESELRNRLFHEDNARDCSEIEELRKIVAKKQIEQDKREYMNCLFIERGILRR